MRSGLTRLSLPILWRYTPVLCAGVMAIGAELSTNAIADTFRFRPAFTLEQIFTDNVREDSVDRDADGVTVLSASLVTQLNTARITAGAAVSASYYEFWGANDLDSFVGNGIAAGRLEILKGVFFVDALAERQRVFQAAQDINGTGFADIDAVEQTNYDIGPSIQTSVFGLADLLIRASYAQTFFDQPVVGPTLALIDDVTIKQVAGHLTTGERSSLYTAEVGAEHVETDTGFKQRNVIGSLTLNVMPQISTIARIGYENTEDPTVTPIRGTIWAAGFRYRPSDNSEVHVEYGRRFNDVSWVGDFNIQVTPKLSVTGTYEDSLTPLQFTLTRTFTDLLAEDGTLDVGAPDEPDFADPDVIDLIVRDRDLEVSSSFVNGLQTYTVSTTYSQRFYPSLLASEKLWDVDFRLTERLSRALTYALAFRYENGYETILGDPTFKSYEPSVAFTYTLNPEVSFAGQYYYRFLTEQGGIDTHENVIQLSVTRTL